MGDFRLQGKVTAITGAGSGIGRSIAFEFAAAGAMVYVLDLNAEAAKETASAIRSKEGQSKAIECDVSVQISVKQAFESILKHEGRLDVLVNNAGIAGVGTAENTTEEDFDRILCTNVKGVYNCIQAVVKSMKTAGTGVILNMSSVAATVGIPERFAYSTSKGAVLAMTYQTARDYVKEGVRCNAISPARVHTPFVDGYLKENYPGREQEMFQHLARTQPLGRMAKPEEIAALARYLCSDEAAFITGTNFAIDGGFIRLQSS